MTTNCPAESAEPREITAKEAAPRRALLPAARALGGPDRIAVAALEAGVTQDQLDVPICPAAEPRDDMLFIEPTSNAPRHWLPRYEIAEEVVGGERRYRVALGQRGDDLRLELVLQRVPAPQVEAQADPANILVHALAVVLSFDAGSGTRRSLTFDEVGPPDETVAAALTLSRLVDRDQVLAALRDPARNATLDVRRSFRVALPETARGGATETGGLKLRHPITVLKPAPGRIIFERPPHHQQLSHLILHKPQLAFLRSERFDLRGRRLLRHWVSVTNWQSYGEHFFAAAPDLPPCGNNTNSSRSWVDLLDASSGKRLNGFCALGAPANLKQLYFASVEGQPVPNAVRLQIHDRKANKKVVSDPVALQPTAPEPPPPPPKPTFRVVDTALEHRVEVQPFAFLPELHPYVYDVAGLGDDVDGPPGVLLRERERFGDRTFTYFRDPRHRELIYYLPDRFRLLRHSGDLRSPQMTLTVSQPDSSTDSAQCALDYVIGPWVDPARLKHARRSLSRRLGLEEDALDFQRLLPANVQYTVRRPSALGLVHDLRTATPQIVQEPLSDRLLMPLEDFNVAFRMMGGNGAGQFGGTVTAQVQGWDDESIAVEFDLAAISDEMLRIRIFMGGEELLVKIANMIESPIVLEEARLEVTQGDTSAELDLPGTATALRIAPGEEAEFACPRPAGITGAPVQVRPLAGIRTEVDHQAVLEAILETATAEYYRTIRIETIPSVFRVPEDDPEQQIIIVVVSFETGSSLMLTPEELRTQVRIDYPVLPVLLQQRVDTSYTYRCRFVRKNGTEHELDPITASDDLILVYPPNQGGTPR